MTPKLQYAGFWPRFIAMWIDVIIFSPMIILLFWGNNRFQHFQLYYLVPGLIIGLVYNVYLVKQFGGTPGKLIMGLNINRLDGSSVRYKDAFLRELPGYALSTLGSLAFALATLKISEAEYFSLTLAERSQRLAELKPTWHTPVIWIYNIWIWSEFIVLLTNEKKRALHDFIAGTVVTKKGSNKAVVTTPASAAA